MKLGNARIANIEETNQRIFNNGQRITRAILGNVNWDVITGEKIDSKAFFSCGVIEMQKGGEIAAHSHKTREEIYYIISGVGEVTVDNKTVTLQPGTAIWFPSEAEHRIFNPNKKPLIVYFTTATTKPGHMAHG